MALTIPIMNPIRIRDNTKRPDWDNVFPLPDGQQVGQLMEEGVFNAPYVQDWIKNKAITLQLRTDNGAPDMIAVRANQSNLISSWVNSVANPYETFTASGSKITSAINGVATGACFSDAFAVYNGEVITVIFDEDLNAGQVPDIVLVDQISGAAKSNNETTADGLNTITLTATESTNVQVRLLNNAASNYSTSNITVLRSYRTIAGVDITPGGWVGDDVYKYTFTPDFTGLFYLFFEDTNYITDFIYAWPDSAIYRSNFITGVDTWAVETQGGTNTTIANSNDKLQIMIVDEGAPPATRPVIEFTVDASFVERDWILKIKANTGTITNYETDDGAVSVDLTLDGTEQIITGNGVAAANKILLEFDSTGGEIMILIDYVILEARDPDMTPKRRLIEVDFQNSINDYGMVFFDVAVEKYAGKIILTGRMLDPQPANDRSVFESDRAALELLRSTPKKIYALKINDVHRAMVDQINHIFACDTLTINGEVYQVPESLEVEPIEGSDLVNINVNIQQVENDYFIT